ncbi:DUF317 domain-containing protein [Kitasatospora sp. NPDC058032]|uniref:DUF317 domain-containing protein n=1 Tax=Kitasatospora sp. NPDC058032 TaxID=3346307 RepID=UPI0036D8FEB4
MTPTPAAEVDGDVHVHPAYLAGAHWAGDAAFHPLLGLGAHTHHDDLGNYFAATPDGRIRLGFIPEQDWDTLWQLAVAPRPFAAPAWVASFSEDTPTEIVTAVTTELAAMYRPDEDAWLTARRPGILESMAPYTAQGWTVRPTSRGELVAAAPDGHAEASYSHQPLDRNEAEQAGQDGRYTLSAGGPQEGWYGRFSSGTPARILDAAATAMLTPTPAVRYRGCLTPYARRNATITPITPPTPSPLDVHRALAARTRSVPRIVQSAPPERAPAATLAWSTSTPTTAPGRR